jgi:hypothetical protein
MVSQHVVSQLILFVLLWLVVILPLTRPKRSVLAPVTPTEEPEPLNPKRHRATAPAPCAGLTHKPQGALGERGPAPPPSPPPVPPDPMPSTNRRPREVDTSRPFGPHGHCDSRGWLGLGKLRANGHPSGGPWRPCDCTACKGYFWETQGTLFHGKQAAVELIVRGVACVAEGLSIRATARGFEVAPTTGRQWRVEAAEQLRAFSAAFLWDLHLEQ